MRKLKTEHAGAKNGRGYFGRRAVAKQISRKQRRVEGAKLIRAEGPQP